jgi:hypothetical protein
LQSKYANICVYIFQAQSQRKGWILNPGFAKPEENPSNRWPHMGTARTEDEFLDEIQTKVLRVFLLAIKGIDRPFGRGVESRLIGSALVNWRLG